MAKYALLLEYDGSDFCGWQIQAQQPSVQGALETALSLFADQPVTTITAGRTDTGVHALNQVVHFESNATRKLDGWIKGVNANLPPAIRVKQVRCVADDFDARFSALSRTYHYYLGVGAVKPTHLRKYIGWYCHALDIDLMREAAELLRGSHDFSSFRAVGCQAKTPVRNLQQISIEQQGNMLRFELKANAFLHHMVRNIIGALVYVGEGRLTLAQFEQVFKAANRRLAPPTFMPNGLYLVNVEYHQSLFENDFNLWRFNA